jgi:hypothetical protein
MIDAIAVRQITLTSKAGAPDTRDMIANNIVNVINQRVKSTAIPLPFADRFFIFNSERCDGTCGDSSVLAIPHFRDDRGSFVKRARLPIIADTVENALNAGFRPIQRTNFSR